MPKTLWKLMLLITVVSVRLSAEPIKVHPSNPHYFLFKGKATVLITSAEHYGAVINGDFDYVAYFDALKAYGLNYTRIYPGELFEPVGKFMKGNTLGPKPASLIVPWARSSTPGYMLGGNKFDLDQWDAAYFARLKDFVAQAAERDIVVEICFFNGQYSDTWPISPLYYENNIQGAGRCDHEDFQTLKHPDLVRRQDDYVRKIIQEVNSYDNVILEICDEAMVGGTPIEDASAWVGHFVELIQETERTLPKKHLVAQQVEGPLGGPYDWSSNPGVAIIVAQYAYGRGWLGGMQALDEKYGFNKPLEFNETNYYPLYSGDKVGASRVEAWEFIVGGGGSFNQLNGSYTAANPAGNTPDNTQVLTALRALKDFIYSFDFLKMRPDKRFVTGGVPAGAHCRAISERGRQYAFYLHHSAGAGETAYTVTPGNYVENLVLDLPAGAYKAEWVDPASGNVIGADTLSHQGGKRTLTTPKHSIDIALRIKQLAGTH
ncbi:MAG: hypothetical protein ACE145_06475 [Terriglobia bacterium]